MRKAPLSALALAALLSACGGEQTNPAPTASTMTDTTTGGAGSGGTGGSAGSAGSAGMAGAGGAMETPLSVGVGKQSITPDSLGETEWNDVNNDGYYDPGSETFTDTNGNGKFDATWIAGFGNGRPAKAVHDPLEVRAIAFNKNGVTTVVCILDAIGYFIEDMDVIRNDPKVKALAIDHVMIGATHVHEGLDTVGLWGETQLQSGRKPEYIALTQERAVLAIEEAVKSMKPAKMKVAERLAVDTVTMSTKAYVNDTRDPIIYDPTVTIAQFTEEANPDATIATLLHWSAHPEYTGEGNDITADYVHWFRDVVENGLPAENIKGLGGTAVFVQGALGGQVGPGGGTAPIGKDGMPVTQSGLAKAEAAGTSVAKLALAALAEDGKDAADLSLTYREKELYARVDNVAYYFLNEASILKRPFYMYDKTKPIGTNNPPYVRTQISYFQVGPLAMITAPGELHPELWVGGYDGKWSFGQMILTETMNAPDLNTAPKAPYLRDVMLQNPGVKYAFVAGLTQDFLGYIVAKFNFVVADQMPYFNEADGDHYEETNSIGPLAEEQIQHPMMDLAKTP